MTGSPAAELQAAADKLSPATASSVDLTVEYPDLDAACAQLLRGVAFEMELAAGTEYAATGTESDPASWRQALAVARAINGGRP